MKVLLNEIQNTEGCFVLPASGLPKIDKPHVIPVDLDIFYRECGGVKFFTDSKYSVEVVSAADVRLSNPIILPDDWETDIPSDDISNDWYIIAQAGPEQRISIDLNKTRLGKCYDSFWDIHASPGESPVIASSFTELLTCLFKSRGKYWFWLEDSFVSQGDAYD